MAHIVPAWMGTMNIELVLVAGLVLLLCVPSTLRAKNQGVDSAARPACIVDLKPGDVRLFAPSASTAGKLRRWLDLQAASVGTQYVLAKNGLGVTIRHAGNGPCGH